MGRGEGPCRVERTPTLQLMPRLSIRLVHHQPLRLSEAPYPSELTSSTQVLRFLHSLTAGAGFQLRPNSCPSRVSFWSMGPWLITSSCRWGNGGSEKLRDLQNHIGFGGCMGMPQIPVIPVAVQAPSSPRAPRSPFLSCATVQDRKARQEEAISSPPLKSQRTQEIWMARKLPEGFVQGGWGINLHRGLRLDMWKSIAGTWEVVRVSLGPSGETSLMKPGAIWAPSGPWSLPSHQLSGFCQGQQLLALLQ